MFFCALTFSFFIHMHVFQLCYFRLEMPLKRRCQNMGSILFTLPVFPKIRTHSHLYIAFKWVMILHNVSNLDTALAGGLGQMSLVKWLPDVSTQSRVFISEDPTDEDPSAVSRFWSMNTPSHTEIFKVILHNGVANCFIFIIHRSQVEGSFF